MRRRMSFISGDENWTKADRLRRIEGAQKQSNMVHMRVVHFSSFSILHLSLFCNTLTQTLASVVSSLFLQSWPVAARMQQISLCS